ncbi:MAG: META domain-containing protein, partial [Leifsonia flava]
SAGAPFLFLSSRGSFSGNDGCNTLTGPWEATDDGGIRFPATVSTEMFCEGVDAWLGEAVLGRAISGVMSLYSEDGEVIGQLRARR